MVSPMPTANPKKAAFKELHDAGQDFGDFYPTGYIFAAFPQKDSALSAREDLLAAGWSEADCRHFDPETVRAGSQHGLEHATILSSIGSSLKMVELHRDLAAKGCHFLLIRAADDESSVRVMAIINKGPISLAQRYQTLAIETLAQNDPLTDRQK